MKRSRLSLTRYQYKCFPLQWIHRDCCEPSRYAADTGSAATGKQSQQSRSGYRHYVIRSQLTRTVADIPTPAIEYLLACADATPNTKAWYESTTVGWAIGHPGVSVVDALHSAITDGRTAWASAMLRQTFHADQHAAAETVAELAADGHLSELSTDFFDDLSRPTAWPAGPTGSWWEEFAYSFEWDEAIEARVRKIVSE